MSLEKQQQRQIIVVDNASTDKTVDIVKKNFKTVRLFSLSQNRGYAGGNNFGIEKALELNCEFVLILNPDTVRYSA
ncbi:MAG: Glycosyl transferase family 2 [Candidatus Gottesmanbacteria bacterium GW2011_GWA1_43_11]|uniref:Glycosyl transferase family 2 n=1 Tax=Candidatus Gottesmanbacteria bacterium GW2011_GWA1_43_11 TaxID=1618436 RepID=A0A0G1CHS9_9BACT|nr:MAG: Glycosyl transferase family 2 [Candidatus Gottesmanbacteria bacterium GW2011_GWA1_43_11]